MKAKRQEHLYLWWYTIKHSVDLIIQRLLTTTDPDMRITHLMRNMVSGITEAAEEALDVKR